MREVYFNIFIILCCFWITIPMYGNAKQLGKPRVIVTSDGEIDDECSMVRFLLYANEWDIEGIITSSSQYHWRGHKWAGDNWLQPCLDAYTEVYSNLIKHDKQYPSPEYLQTHTFLGNVDAEGEMDLITAGSQHIVNVLLDRSDNRPVWIQAWGGTNTIARALRTIEEEHPQEMDYVAQKLRFFFIWEQDSTYQSYIRPYWGKYNIMTIISDQFEAIAYRWKMVQPKQMQAYFEGEWMKKNILNNHGALCGYYKAHDNGDFRSEGDSPAFLHTINVGLRNLENPDWGGWGGRYVRVRENTWLDKVPDPNYVYPEGRWYGRNGWGRASLRPESTVTEEKRSEYFKPMWRWSDAMQNDFAARADWCVKPFKDANHPPVVVLKHISDKQVSKGAEVRLSAVGTTDPDGDKLSYKWWHYIEAGTYLKSIQIEYSQKQNVSIVIPDDAKEGETIHIICEVSDNGTPSLTRYQRVVIHIK